MPLPEMFMEELKARNSIEEVVSSYVNLRRAGRNMVGLCPFHHEKTPSFNIYTENGSFYCFGCGAGGDVITFIRKIENLDYMEAVRMLAQRAGMQVPENHVDDGLGKVKARILEMNREAARFYYSVLQSESGKEGAAYFQKRMLAPGTIRHFGLGYAPDSRFALVNHLKGKGYTDEEIIQANLAFKGRSGNAVDRFYARVMYPIIDLRGNVIAFGGRVLTDVKPKYLNTSDTLVFHKSNTLFAMNFAKNSNTGQLILAEGYMDVIALHQAGFTNAVATLGTALTQEQAHLMARYAKEVIVCYDSDEAGQKASSRAIPLLRNAGLAVKVLTIVGGKDPDEYIRSFGEQGRVRFQQLLDASGNDVEYRLQKVKQSCNMQTPQGRVAYLTGAAEILATLESSIEQEVYAGKLAEEVDVEKTAILRQVALNNKKRKKVREQRAFKEVRQQISGSKDRINPDKSHYLRAASAEEALIAYIQKYPDNAKQIYGVLPAEHFLTAFNRRVYETLVERIFADKSVSSITDLSEGFSQDEISSIARIFAQYHEVPVTSEDAKEYIRVIEQEYANAHVQDVASAHPQDIQEYLAQLKSEKK